VIEMSGMSTFRFVGSACPSASRVRASIRCGARLLTALSLAALLPGCGSPESAAARPAPAPVEVGIVTIQPRAVVLTVELPGRTLAYETSEVRPQVSGIIRQRLFTEGQLVEKGQTLYQIDSSLYRATVAEARANLMSARALHDGARAKADRYAMLRGEQVVSEQDYTDAKAAAAQAAAAIQQAQAALDTANINLRFTEVPAPISGRIGRSVVTTGALVTSGQAEPLATIQRLDPMNVDLQESSSNLLALRRSLARGGSTPTSADVRLKLEDGSEYSVVGSMQFAEATVDPSTSSVTLRARFANPDGLLLPGMYVRAVVVQAEREQAILAPQPGVTRDPKGNATALLVGPGDRVELRELELERTVEDEWLVSRGLAAGDRLIVEGVDKVKPGQAVKVVAVEDPDVIRTGMGGEPGSLPRGAPGVSRQSADGL
jgi:membrane fusion protein (multidrug efflux system)